MQNSTKADHETIQRGFSLISGDFSATCWRFLGAKWLTKRIELNLLEITGNPPRLFDNP